MTESPGLTGQRSALIVVDLQPDFMPGGALPVSEGDALLRPIGDLMARGSFGVQVATQDWHPAHHVSFASQHTGQQPGSVIRLYGHDQVLWPDHCVQGTPGAELHSSLDWRSVSAIIRKGTDPGSDSYSGFRNNWNIHGMRPATGLEGYLRERGVDTVVVCGLARDYCVKWTAEDAAEAGFRTVFLWDLTRPVDPSADASVRKTLEDAGVTVLTSRDLPDG